MTLVRSALLGLCAASLVAACATGGEAQQPIPGTDARVDGPAADAAVADAFTIFDAPSIDAAPNNTFTLSQSTSTVSVPGGSVTCQQSGFTRDNHWYRVFRLADANITGGARITAVSFGVQQSTGSPTLTIRVGTYSGSVSPAPAALDTALITPIAETTYVAPVISSSATQLVTVPITANIPALSQVIVEIAAPDQLATSGTFYLGGNTAGQAAPAYLRSTACNFAQPRDTTTIAPAFENSHLVITASGTL